MVDANDLGASVLPYKAEIEKDDSLYGPEFVYMRLYMRDGRQIFMRMPDASTESQALAKFITDAVNSQGGWTPEVKERCAGKCGDVGDPPCYRLPELTSDAKAEDIRPCAECLKGRSNG